MIMVILACIGGFAIGVFCGFWFFGVIAGANYWSHSKRECRECLRRRVEHGFQVDGKEYKCVEKGK